MKNTTVYEHEVAEIVDGDVISVAHFETMAEAIGFISDEPNHCLYALCKSIGNEQAGEIHRAYAYYENGVLQPYFNDGTRVPEKYLRDRQVTIFCESTK